MPPGPPKLFRTWPTVASPQAQRRLDDDAAMIMWLMGLPRRKPEAPQDPNPGPEDGWERPEEPKPPQGWEQPPQAPHVPASAAYPGLFQGLLYKPPGARGLLDLDPHEPPTPAPAWPAPGAWGSAAQFASTLRLAAETDLRPATLSLSNPGSLPPEPIPPPQPKTYMQGGAGAGADWKDALLAGGFGNPPQSFGGAATAPLDPQRGEPLFNPPGPPKQELPEFRQPPVLLPSVLRLPGPENSEGTDPKELEPVTQSDRRFAAIWPHIGRWEGGYSNDRADSGGETMHGISQKFVKAHGLNIKNLRELTEEQAHNIVKDRIYYGHNIDLLPPELQPQVLDASMRAEYGGIKDLQGVLNDMNAMDNDGKPPEVDGGIGEKTLEAVDSLPPQRMQELRDLYAAKQAERYRGIVNARPNQTKFLPGWLGRTEYFRTLKPPR